MDDFGVHVKLDYVGAENGVYRWYIDHMDEPGGLAASYTHHLCRKAVSTCARREGLRTIHVQKWLPIDKTHAHALLQSWGYRGFVDMPGEKRRDAEPVTAGASAKKKQRKPAPEPVQDDVGSHVPDLDEAAGEEEADKVFPGATPGGSVAKPWRRRMFWMSCWPVGGRRRLRRGLDSVVPRQLPVPFGRATW